jgi:hypothetical protein
MQAKHVSKHMWRGHVILARGLLWSVLSLTSCIRYHDFDHKPQAFPEMQSEMDLCGLPLLNDIPIYQTDPKFQLILRICQRKKSMATHLSSPSPQTSQKLCSPCTWTGQTKMIERLPKGGRESVMQSLSLSVTLPSGTTSVLTLVHRLVFSRLLLQLFFPFPPRAFSQVHRTPQRSISGIFIIYSPTLLAPSPSSNPPCRIHLNFLPRNL